MERRDWERLEHIEALIERLTVLVEHLIRLQMSKANLPPTVGLTIKVTG